jgi:L-rhamnose mutarotase
VPRNAFRLWLKPDPAGIETYVRGHLDPFPGLYDLIHAAGIRRYTIWLDDADLFLTREADDPWHGETLDMDNPVHLRWADTMRPLFDERVERDGAGIPIEVFALDPDGEPGSAQVTYRTGLHPGEASMDAVADAYRSIPLDVVDALRAAGVRREWTWVEDGSAWTYRETGDLDVTEAALAASPAYMAWHASLADQFDEGTRHDGPRRTREVFRCD